MKIEWNKVTRLSQIVAIALFAGVFILAFQLGREFQTRKILGERIVQAKFVCPDGGRFLANFYDRMVHLEFPKEKHLYLPQTISASGARYANSDQSFVFWNKGDTAFIEQNNVMTFNNCAEQK